MRFFSLFLGLCLILPNVSMAACGERHISFQGGQKPADNEFLYQYYGTYVEADNTSGQSFSLKKGIVWECDDEQGCPGGTWAVMDKLNTFKGKRPGPKAYWCDSSVAGDAWIQTSVTNCKDEWDGDAPKYKWKVVTPVGTGKRAGTYYGAIIKNRPRICHLEPGSASQKQKISDCDKYVTCDKKQHAKTCYKKSDSNKTTCTEAIVECYSGYKLADPISGWTIGKGQQLYRNCVRQSSGATAPAQSTVVVHKNTTVVQQVTPSNSSTSGKQACVESGGTWKNKKCSCASEKYLVLNGNVCECTAGYSRNDQKVCVPTDETSCKGLGESVARWENKQCVCVDKRQIYSPDNKKCITNPEVTKCDKVADAQWTGDKCECIKQGYELKDGKCVKGAALVSSEQKDSRTKITSVYKKLNAMSGDFKVSVWKNADGNFNTARLASDSIAAVVLGTTGALVTSNIVKKNQVSGGFEDINCQVGGQTVAGWGDQFSVGIQ